MTKTLNDYIKTLKKDGTNPQINKEAIIQAFEAVAATAVNRHEIDVGIDELPSDFVASLHQGDVVVSGEYTYFVTYFLEEDSVILVFIGNSAIDIYTYGYDNDEYILSEQNTIYFNEIPKVWNLTTFFDQDISRFVTTGMKSGDIIIDDDYIMVGIVIAVTLNNSGHITYLQGVGIADNGASCYYQYNTEDGWNINFINPGTKLYSHVIKVTNIKLVEDGASNDIYITLISTSSELINTAVKFGNLLLNLCANNQYKPIVTKMVASDYEYDGKYNRLNVTCFDQAHKLLGIAFDSGDISLYNLTFNEEELTIVGSITDTVTPL